MRIDQNMQFLGQVLKDVSAGRLAPAPMQRDYVWGKEDVIALCESVLDQLPIGSITLWSAREEDGISPSRSRIGPIEAPGSSTLILDGHNRLATFAWVTEGTGATPADVSGNEAEVWLSGETLCLDFLSRSVVFVPDDEVGSAPVMPAFMSLIPRRIREWIGSRPDLSDPDLDAALQFSDDFSRAILEQRIVTTEIRDASPEEAKSVFLRVCRTGVPMSAEDFDRAMGWRPEAPSP